MRQDVLVVDLDRCNGCKSCELSCKMENGVALGTYRMRVLTIGPNGEYPDLEMYFLPFMCQHCENPSCVKVCPTGACYKSSEDGAVLIDKDICIGCQTCKKACPYGAQSLNKELRVMDKCTLCRELVEKGQNPACVKNCTGKALIFGDINDPESGASKALKGVPAECVYSLPDSGELPAVRYIQRKKKWVEDFQSK